MREKISKINAVKTEKSRPLVSRENAEGQKWVLSAEYNVSLVAVI